MATAKDFAVMLPLLIGTMAGSLSFTAVPNLIVQKACSPLAQPSINDFICNDTAVLAQVSELVTSKATVYSALSAFSSATFGYWRDVTGLTRPLLYIGAVAEALGACAYLLASLDWAGSPWPPAMMQAAISGLFGEAPLNLGASCIIIAASTQEERTLRIQIFSSLTFLIALLGSSASGYFLTSVGYVWMFGAVIALRFISLFGVFLLIDEVPMEGERRTEIGRLKAVFSARPNIAVIWLMMTCGALINAIFPGESSLSLYYYQQRFHFTFKEASLFFSYHFAVAIAGSFAMALLLTKIFKWSDFKFGIMSSILSAISSIATALANTTILLIISAPLSIMKLNLFSITQSVLSKCVDKNELGLFLGIGSIAGICIPFGLNFLYNYVFSKTSKSMPGAFYFVSAGCYLSAMLLLSISSCLYKTPNGTADNSEEVSHSTAADSIEGEELINEENS